MATTNALVTVKCKSAYTDGETKKTHTPRDKPYPISKKRFEHLQSKGLVEEVKVEKPAKG